jgi:hypothetical protein
MTYTLLYHIFPGTNITAKAFLKKDPAKRLLLGIEMSVHVSMLQRHLQYRYITRWITTNGRVEEGVLSEGSHSSAGDGSMVLCSAVSSICYPAFFFIATEEDFNYLDNIVSRGQPCLPLHYRLQ